MQDFFVHESSYVDDGVTIGAGTKVWHFCHIQKGAVIGRNCSLGQNVNVANNVRIGDGVRIQNNVSIYEGVELEDNVFCGPSCVFTNVSTPRAHFPVHGAYARTLVREGASLGANCTIVCGHTVGRAAMIAAGAVVTRCRGDTGRERLCFDGRGTGQADRVGVRMRPSAGRFIRVRVREKVPAGRGKPRESRVMSF